ncbi:MAG: hypothetical protein Q9157_005678 [Trypethelium eluteriae]
MATLPSNFLSNPSANITKQLIDFSQTNLPEYAGRYAAILENVLSKEECDSLVSAAEHHSSSRWEQAQVNIGQGKQMLILDARRCGRIIWDDRDIVARIWARISGHLPELNTIYQRPLVTGPGPLKREETWQMTRLNERMRFLRYTSGDFFKAHCDGVYETPDGQERSYYTLHLYLNDEDSNLGDEKLEGGATNFLSFDEERELGVRPKTGRVLVFQHRGLRHSGDDVLKGVKLTMRTDIMFERKPESRENCSADKLE